MDQHYPLQDLCLSVICGTPILALTAVALRFYARKKRGTTLGAGMSSLRQIAYRAMVLTFYEDDWLVAVAVLLSIGMIAPSYKCTQKLPFCGRCV